MQWKITGKTPIFDLYMFRNQLGILDSEYQRMFDFKRYVLDLAIKQINEHTDITVKYEQHKQGRTITGFSFAFKQKKKSLKVLEEKSKPAKKTAEPLKNAWNTPENSLFKTLCAKCPTLTREYVENLAKTQNKSIHDLLNIMFMEYAKVDSFELQPTS
jgi:plasmid replication initiation protein